MYSAYSASTTATSIKSKSTKGSRMRLSPGLRIPESWRHAIRARLPSRNDTRDIKSTLSQDLQESTPWTWTKDPVLGDSHKDPAAQGQNSTRPRSADHLTAVNALFKPLPRPPDSMLTPNRQSSYFNLSPNISTLGKAVDTNFLSSLAQQVLQSVQLLSEPPMTEANVLVQLGVDAFWMSRRDAGMLERINNLTEHLSASAKAALMKDLDLLLKAPYKYPLQQVMRHGVHIIQVEPQVVYGSDNESLIDMYSYVDRYTQHLIPAPLHIRKEGGGDVEEHLSSNHPVLASQTAFHAEDSGSEALVSHNGSRAEDHAEKRQTNANNLKQPDTHTASDYSQSQVQDNEVSKNNLEPKQSGSVARARAGLLHPQQGSSKDTRSPVDVNCSEDHDKAWTEDLTPEIHELKQPGSVRNARNKIFENPREAPNPPISIARPNRHQQARIPEVPSIPGNVARARIAAENAQAKKAPYESEAEPSKHTKQNNSVDAPTQLGSVARARIAAQDALVANTTKVPDEPADTQPRTLVQVSSLPALKRTASDARAGDHLRPSQSGVQGFPERFSSLPLRTIEERRQNFKKGLSPISGHFKAASTNAIARLRDWNVTTGSNANRSQDRDKDFDAVDVNKDALRISETSSPDLLTGSPLFAPALATRCEDYQASPSTQGSTDETTPVKPIFDIHQAVTTFDRFRLRGGASSDDDHPPANTVKRRISTLLGKVTPLQDHERPPKALWWLAGGRTGGVRKVPTAGELRERRKVEEANQEVVGYIGTVFGVRAVRRLPMRDVEAEDEVTEEKAAGGKKDLGKAATVEDEREDEEDVGSK